MSKFPESVVPTIRPRFAGLVGSAVYSATSAVMNAPDLAGSWGSCASVCLSRTCSALFCGLHLAASSRNSAMSSVSQNRGGRHLDAVSCSAGCAFIWAICFSAWCISVCRFCCGPGGKCAGRIRAVSMTVIPASVSFRVIHFKCCLSLSLVMVMSR